MSRHVFYSHHYDEDRSRVAPLLGPGSRALQGQLEASVADWDKLKRSGSFGIKRWLDQQLKGRSCTIVLIGSHTASRPLILEEIKRSWELGLSLIGVHIHPLKDAKGQPSTRGDNPFLQPATGLGDLGATVPVFESSETDSKLAYRDIADHLPQWVEQGVARS
jgi:hypothetical protein